MREFPIVKGEGMAGVTTYGMQSHPTLRIADDGKAQVPQTHGRLELWAEDGRSITLKEWGHQEYYNQYNPPFKVPTQFHVFLKMADGNVVEVATVPVRKG